MSRFLNLDFRECLDFREVVCTYESPNFVFQCIFLGESPALLLVPEGVSDPKVVKDDPLSGTELCPLPCTGTKGVACPAEQQ